MNPLAYQPRRVAASGTVSLAGSRLKVYLLWAEGRDPGVLRHGEWLLSLEALPALPGIAQDHGLGFLIVHLASDGDYLLLSRWVGANMLQHRVYRCCVDAQGFHDIVSLADSGVVACVWELEIMKFERDAWIRSVLTPGRLDATTGEAYLATTLSGWT